MRTKRLKGLFGLFILGSVLLFPLQALGAFDPLNPPDLSITSIERQEPSGLLVVTVENIAGGDSILSYRHPRIVIDISGDLEKHYTYTARTLADKDFILAGGSSTISPRILAEGYYEIEACVDPANRVPEIDDTNNCMSVEIDNLGDPGTLDVTLASVPVSHSVTRGAEEVHTVGYALSVGEDSDLTITDLVLQGFLDEDMDNAFEPGLDNFVYVNEVVNSVRLYDGDGNLLSVNDESVALDGTVEFNGMNWYIEAGNTELLIVEADVGMSGVPHNSDYDSFAFDIDEVTSQNEDGDAVVASGYYPNCAGSGPTTCYPTRDITVRDAGYIKVTHPDNPVLDDVAVADADSPADPLLVGRYKIYSNYEDFRVEELTFIHTGTDDDAIDEIILRYGLNEESSALLVAGSVHFTALDIVVPESEGDENAVEVELYVTTNPVAMGATDSGDVIQMEYDYDGGFEAVGQDSGSVITETMGISYYGTTSNIEGGDIALFRSLPTFEQDLDGSAPCPDSVLVAATESDVYCFNVTADSHGDVGLYQLTFEVNPYLLNTGLAAGQLASANGWKIYEYDANGIVGLTTLGEGTWYGSDEVSITFMSEEVISAGTTSHYVLKAPISFTPNINSSMLMVRLSAESAFNHVAPVGAANVVGNNVWTDRTAASHSLYTLDWVNTYKVDVLPTDYLTLSEA